MRRIRVKNFGPVREGFTNGEGWIDIRRVTIFIGDNGTGKSTVAKLVSTFSWLEKALFQGRISEKELYRVKSLERHLRYHKLEHYFGSETEIDYEGDAFKMSYRKEKLTATRKETESQDYKVPKVMYVGSERNFLSVASKPDKIAGLPASLGTFLDEFRDALEKIPDRLEMPVGNVKLSYQKQNRITYVHGTNKSYNIRLTEASSGIQSATPLFVVSRYLGQLILEQKSESVRAITSEEAREIKAEVARIFNNPKLTSDAKDIMMEVIFGRYRATLFQNIVEEPEQNLFPDSQRNILNELLKVVNSSPDNELLITTHSPYLISYLSLAIKAAKVLHFLRGEGQDLNTIALKAIRDIVPEGAEIMPEEIVIYEVGDNGEVQQLETEEGIPTDENDLNERLMEINELFSDLIDIKREYKLG